MKSLTGLSVADGIAACIGRHFIVSAISSDQSGGLIRVRRITHMRNL